jgi:hypothetical protein
MYSSVGYDAVIPGYVNNKTYHLAVTVDNGNTVNLYVDGVLI